VSARTEFAVVAGPGAPQDVSVLVGAGAASWEAARVEREGCVDGAARLVFLFVDAPPDEQKRWLAALGQNASPETVVAVYAPYLAVSELAAAYRYPAQVVGFDFLEGRLAKGNLVEVAPGLRTAPAAVAAVEEVFARLEVEVERVADQAGLVLRRVLFMIINEACWALFEGVASREDIDSGMKLGVNYPAGPLEWADAIGVDKVYAGLKALQEEYGDDRYRPCPLLRKMVAAGHTGKRAGIGFTTHVPKEAGR
jgi:3-hydroxybutyryl-CoA dehydrogenase